MFKRYFQQELGHLRSLAAEFSKAHPALAPMLSEPTTDPDVERLLEGVAFLTAMVRQKQDDEFPEIVHELARLLFPHYLRPLPSATIVAFSPNAALQSTATVPAGVQLASLPVDGTSCRFRTSFDVQVDPLTLIDAELSQIPGEPPAIDLSFEMIGRSCAAWQPDKLRLFLGGDFTAAADIYLLLNNHLEQILITTPDTGETCRLSADQLTAVGFSPDEGLLPYPTNAFPAYRVLQEYFHLPERFLFFDLLGLEAWQYRGDGSRFMISFQLDQVSEALPEVTRKNFVLFATPAVNIFHHDADPIRLDHKKTAYRVRPAGRDASHYQIYSIEQVSGFVQGTARVREYTPFDCFATAVTRKPVYHQTARKSPVDDRMDLFLSVAYPKGADLPVSETLSVQLLCTNGSLAESVQTGDVCEPTSSSPEFVSFRNIRPPTVNVLPPLGSNLIWRLLSHLSLNYLSLVEAKNLQALLGLYIFEESRDRSAVLANMKRISGIDRVKGLPSDRLVDGTMMRGREITIDARSDHFAGHGDLYLFGSVLDYFLGAYSSMNSYTRLVIKDVLKGNRYQWIPRTGAQPLI